MQYITDHQHNLHITTSTVPHADDVDYKLDFVSIDYLQMRSASSQMMILAEAWWKHQKLNQLHSCYILKRL